MVYSTHRRYNKMSPSLLYTFKCQFFYSLPLFNTADFSLVLQVFRSRRIRNAILFVVRSRVPIPTSHATCNFYLSLQWRECFSTTVFFHSCCLWVSWSQKRLGMGSQEEEVDCILESKGSLQRKSQKTRPLLCNWFVMRWSSFAETWLVLRKRVSKWLIKHSEAGPNTGSHKMMRAPLPSGRVPKERKAIGCAFQSSRSWLARPSKIS